MGIDYQYQWEKENRHKDNEFFCQVCFSDIEISYHSSMRYSVGPCKRCIENAREKGYDQAEKEAYAEGFKDGTECALKTIAEAKGGEKNEMERT